MFYIKNGDFGYKPRGLFYNILLMQSGFDINSLDFADIFEKLEKTDISELTAKAFSKEITIINTDKRSNKQYRITNPSPMYEYQRTPETKSNISLPYPQIPNENILFGHKAAYTDNQNKEIIFLSLAFELNLPLRKLKRANGLLRDHPSALPFLETDILDIGKPCFVIHTGFFTKYADRALNEINKIFSSTAGIVTVPKDMVYQTKLEALGMAERSSYILKLAYENRFDGDIHDIQQALFTERNLFYAVCTHKDNFPTVSDIIGKLSLYPRSSFDIPTFSPAFGEKIIQVQSTVNNISLVFSSDSPPAEKFALAQILKNTYLWENVRCKGAYGCDCELTPQGNILITSFKDINFESTVETIKNGFAHLRDMRITPEDIHRFKIMCYNEMLRPKTPKKANIYALERLFGKKSINGIHTLNADKIHQAAEKTKFLAMAAFVNKTITVN